MKVNRECRVDSTGVRKSLVLTDYRYAKACSRCCMRAGNRTFRTGSDPRANVKYPSTRSAFFRKTDAARKTTVMTMHEQEEGVNLRLDDFGRRLAVLPLSVFVQVKEERFNIFTNLCVCVSCRKLYIRITKNKKEA